jgi:transposase
MRTRRWFASAPLLALRLPAIRTSTNVLIPLSWGWNVDRGLDGIWAGKKGQGDTWLRSALGQAANGAARTQTFLGERYHRIARRRGKTKAQVAVARSILVIIWHLLNDPATRFTDLGPGYYQARTDKDKKIKNHIRQIEALGFTVTLTKAA